MRWVVGVDTVLRVCTPARHFDGFHGALEWGKSASKLTATSPHCQAGVYQLVTTHMVDCVLGHDVHTGTELQELLAHFKGNPFAKAALDNAWWALHSVVTGRPLWELIGGVSPAIEVGDAFGLGQWDGGKGVEELCTKVQYPMQYPPPQCRMHTYVPQTYPRASDAAAGGGVGGRWN